jgi:hypothetical protein
VDEAVDPADWLGVGLTGAVAALARTVSVVEAVTVWPWVFAAVKVYVVVVVGVTVAVPDEGLRLAAPTDGAMLTVEAPVTLQDRVLN